MAAPAFLLKALAGIDLASMNFLDRSEVNMAINQLAPKTPHEVMSRGSWTKEFEESARPAEICLRPLREGGSTSVPGHSCAREARFSVRFGQVKRQTI